MDQARSTALPSVQAMAAGTLELINAGIRDHHKRYQYYSQREWWLRQRSLKIKEALSLLLLEQEYLKFQHNFSKNKMKSCQNVIRNLQRVKSSFKDSLAATPALRKEESAVNEELRKISEKLDNLTAPYKNISQLKEVKQKDLEKLVEIKDDVNEQVCLKNKELEALFEEQKKINEHIRRQKELGELLRKASDLSNLDDGLLCARKESLLRQSDAAALKMGNHAVLSEFTRVPLHDLLEDTITIDRDENHCEEIEK